LTALCTFDERFVIPPAHREEAIEMMQDPQEYKQAVGFGFREEPKRGY
jgi:nitrate reductase beta subunit